nr:ribonuclease HI [bacterium]
MDEAVILYTDGACSGNPGPGGWAAILSFKGHVKELSGYQAATTNNRMELTAVIRGLQALKRPCRVDVHADSAYVVNAVRQGWLASWQARGWAKADGKPVENIDLWQELLAAMQPHTVSFIKVRGHAGDDINNRCDALARGQIAQHRG